MLIKNKNFGFFLRCVALIFAILAVCTMPAKAEGGDLNAQLERLAKETANIKQIKSEFKQTKYISFMDESLESEGFFTFVAPDELEWRYVKPLSSGITYKGGQAKMWSSTSQDAEAESDKKSGGGEEAIAKIIAEQLLTWTRLDIPKLKKSYNISMQAESPLTIRLTPKELAPGNPVRDFKLIFADDGVAVRQITLFEAEDDYTQIDFFNFQRQ